MEENLNQNFKDDENISNENFKEEEINEEEIQEINSVENIQNEIDINNNINKENKNEENIDEPIYVMTLALEQGKSEKIEIYENSDPAQLAYDFCSKNNLDFNALDYLKEQITNLLESYAKNENEENTNDNNEQTEEKNEINNNNDEDISVPEIEEVRESQEFNVTENYKENTKNSGNEINNLNSENNKEGINNENQNEILNEEILGEINIGELQNNNKHSNNRNDRHNIKINNDLNNEKNENEIFNINITSSENKDNSNIVENNNIDFNINKNENNENINEEYLVENDEKFEEKKDDENLYNKDMYFVNSNNKNTNKRRNYKINEDIIIGMGDYDANNNKSINKSENISMEINDSNKIKNYNNKILLENKNNFNNDPKHDKKNLSLIPISKKYTEQFLTNNFNQETKTNTCTNNNIIQNEEEENNNIYTPKNIQYIYKNNTSKINYIKKETPENTEKNFNYKKINKIKHKENISNSDKRKNTKNLIQFLSDRNKLIKQEKKEEIKTIKKEMDKFDKRSKINNNYLTKNTSLGKMNKIKEEYGQKYSFKPVINDNYKTDLSFNERLKIFNNISKIKKEELKNNLSNLKDKQSGQDFFKPKLISKQFSFSKTKTKKENTEENMDIFNKNYLYRKKYNLDKENLYNKFYEQNYEPIFYSKKISDKLINESNRKAFSNLFNVLDSDQDDLITSVSINLNNVPQKILKIIEPLLIELKEDNQTLNQDEFIKAMNKLFENISFTDRREIINEYNNYNTKKQTNENNKILERECKNYNFNFSRPKTPVFISYNNNYNNIKEKKVVNKNTNKLAEKHFMKMQKMMDVYNNKYNKKSNKKNNNSLYNKTSNSNFFTNDIKNSKFSSINNCTFNNYLKNLN